MLRSLQRVPLTQRSFPLSVRLACTTAPMPSQRLRSTRRQVCSRTTLLCVPVAPIPTSCSCLRRPFSSHVDPAETIRAVASSAHKDDAAFAGAICWKCGHAIANGAEEAAAAPPMTAETAAVQSASDASAVKLFCPKCNILQPEGARQRSYYDVFNIPVSYAISPPALDAAYKTLQKSLHPDNFSSSSEEQHDQANQLSSFVNHAYTVMKQPYERAMYLLSLNGEELSESTDTITDPELLMEIMEIREELESASSLPVLARLASENRQALRTLYAQLEEAHAAKDVARMRQLTIKLSYLQNIETEVYKKMPLQ